MTARPTRPRMVVVSGACGNLGRKVIEALAATPWCERIIGIDRHNDASAFSAEAQSRLTLSAGDLTQPKAAWRHWGSAAGAAMSKDDRGALRWYRGMWLSNADLAALFTAAVTADAGAWPSRHIIINGVSRNRGTDWDLASAEALIGYTPRDDLYDHVGPE